VFLYITSGIGHLSVGKLNALITVNHEFPKRFFTILHAFFDMKIYEFDFQPPVEPQDAKFKSIYG